jgi:hypothetical protein
VKCRPISRQCLKYVHATIEKVLQEVFLYVVCAMPSARLRSCRHTSLIEERCLLCGLCCVHCYAAHTKHFATVTVFFCVVHAVTV